MEPLIQAVAGPALRLTTLLVEDRTTAEDIVQEAFLRAWQSPKAPRDLAGFRRWVYRITVNLCRDHHRRMAVRRALRLTAEPSPDPAAIVEGRIEGAAVDEAVRSLSRAEREVVTLRYFEDASYDEMAQILGKRAGACRALVHRALKKVGTRLTAQGLAPEGANP